MEEEIETAFNLGKSGMSDESFRQWLQSKSPTSSFSRNEVESFVEWVDKNYENYKYHGEYGWGRKWPHQNTEFQKTTSQLLDQYITSPEYKNRRHGR